MSIDSMRQMIVNTYKEKVKNAAIPVRENKSLIDKYKEWIDIDYSYYTYFAPYYDEYVNNYNKIKYIYTLPNVSTLNDCLNSIIDYKNNYINILSSINEDIKTYYDLVMQTLNYIKVYAYCIDKNNPVVKNINDYIANFPAIPE